MHDTTATNNRDREAVHYRTASNETQKCNRCMTQPLTTIRTAKLCLTKPLAMNRIKKRVSDVGLSDLLFCRNKNMFDLVGPTAAHHQGEKNTQRNALQSPHCARRRRRSTNRLLGKLPDPRWCRLRGPLPNALRSLTPLSAIMRVTIMVILAMQW